MSRSYLGERLRAARKKCKKSGQEIASSLRVNQSTISRLERGQLRPDLELIAQYLDALSLPRSEARELELLAQSFLVEFDRWRCGEAGTITSLQKLAREWEHSSSIMQTFSPQVIPGLFQTEAYMHCLFLALGERNEKSRISAVRARLKRRTILKGKDKKFTFIIPQDSLRLTIGSEEVMKAQLKSLRKWVYGENGVILKIIPRGAVHLVLPMTNFIIYNEKFVFIETSTRGVRVFAEDELSEYLKMFGCLEQMAVQGDAADKIIKLEELR